MDAAVLRSLEKQLKVRVRTGCKTCRKRRVKCDERKPLCERCRIGQRECEYEEVDGGKSPAFLAASQRNSSFLAIPQSSLRGTSPLSQSGGSSYPSPSPYLSPSPPLSAVDAAEARSLDFFRNRTLQYSMEYFDSEFWSRRVFQLAQIEPAIKHALVSLSALHEAYESSISLKEGPRCEFAFSQYSKAVHHSKALLKRETKDREHFERVLISCVLFVCYEILVGNYRVASMHLQSGQQILRQIDLSPQKHGNFMNKADAEMEDEISDLSAVFSLLDLQAMSFNDNSALYPYHYTRAPTPLIVTEFQNLSIARKILVDIVRLLFHTIAMSEMHEKPPDLEITCNFLHIALSSWLEAFQSLEYRISQSEYDSRSQNALRILKIYYRTAELINICVFTADEMSWDAHIEGFREMIDITSTLPSFSGAKSPKCVSKSTDKTPSLRFTATPATSPTMILFLTAIRCRDPVLRRRAIALLLLERRREGAWDSLGAARAAAEVVKFEEGLTGHLNLEEVESGLAHAAQIPREKRIRMVMVNMRMEEGLVELIFCMSDTTVRGPIWVEI